MTRLSCALLLLFSLVLSGLALASHDSGPLGSSYKVVITEQGPGRTVVIDLETDPAITGRDEAFFYLFPRDAETSNSIRRKIPPLELGHYHLEVMLPKAGEWGISMRYGVGLDLSYAFVSPVLDPDGSGEQRFAGFFRDGLGEDVPNYIQPLGFTIFGLLLLTALLLLGVILRRLARARRQLLGTLAGAAVR